MLKMLIANKENGSPQGAVPWELSVRYSVCVGIPVPKIFAQKWL